MEEVDLREVERFQRELYRMLLRVEVELQFFNVPGAERFEQLATQVYEPCVVAVVGRVKAGKSLFINTLLQRDVATVGVRETTNTINYYRYGEVDPRFPVRCIWRDNAVTKEDQQFLEELQCWNEEARQRAERIDHLEYYLPIDDLKDIILVDTPGTEAVIPAHQQTTSSFIRLQQYYDQRTRYYQDSADAIIYLVDIDLSARDERLLEEFRQMTASRGNPLNAIGVISKIDLSLDLLQHREVYTSTLAQRLREYTNQVVPTSAGLQRALYLLSDDDLKQLITTLHDIPPTTLNKLLSDPQLFVDPDIDCCVSSEQRQALRDLGRQLIAWPLFVVIARIAVTTTSDQGAQALRQQLQEMAGIHHFRQILKQHILQRSHPLRCNRIVNEALQHLQYIVQDYIQSHLIKDEQKEQKMLDSFLQFIRDAGSNVYLEEYLHAHLAQQTQHLRECERNLKQGLEAIARNFEQYNDNFAALNKVRTQQDHFSQEEIEELTVLFGFYSQEMVLQHLPFRDFQSIRNRHTYWRLESRANDQIRREVAEQAIKRYGTLLQVLHKARE